MGAEVLEAPTTDIPPLHFHDDSYPSEYSGAYSVELIPRGKEGFEKPSPNAEVVGNAIHVKNGSFTIDSKGIQFRSEGHPFYWVYNRIKIICDENGKILWKNRRLA